MNVSLYQAAAAMNANARWQEMISENLAAGSVPGYRKQDVSFNAIEAGLSHADNHRNVIPAATVGTNFMPGELRSTGGPLDVAIEGPGFFEVQLPNGSHSFTRDGELHVSAQGQLVTKQGYPVMSDAGPLQFDPNNSSPITISADGDVSQGDELKGKLHLVEFNQPGQLTSIGGGYFLADKAGVQPSSASSSKLRQGFLEGPNTSPTAEMANLITSMRLFEANQHVLTTQDERMGKVILELGGTS